MKTRLKNSTSHLALVGVAAFLMSAAISLTPLHAQSTEETPAAEAEELIKPEAVEQEEAAPEPASEEVAEQPAQPEAVETPQTDQNAETVQQPEAEPEGQAVQESASEENAGAAEAVTTEPQEQPAASEGDQPETVEQTNEEPAPVEQETTEVEPQQETPEAEPEQENAETAPERSENAESKQVDEAETSTGDSTEQATSEETPAEASEETETNVVEEEPATEQSKAEQAAAKEAEAEAAEPVAVSEEAEQPKELAAEPVEQQLKRAETEQVVVVPDEITAEQKQALKAAEEKRQDDARKRRRELIGAAAVGAVVGALLPRLGGRVAADQGDVLVIERGDQLYTRRDDSSLFREPQATVYYDELPQGRTQETIERPNGVKVITIRDSGGYILSREKEFPDGERVILYDFRDDFSIERVNYDQQLDPIVIDIPQDRYIVSARRADRDLFYETFQAAPVEETEDAYVIRDIRENERLRAKVRRLDLDTIQFATGSAFVTASQVRFLGDVAGAMLDVIERDPSAVFLIEGHTDAVGSDVSNLVLSDRRAEAVGRILSSAYDVPPENLVIQGYGEQFLKVNTQGPSAANRRVAIRNISPLLTAGR